MLTFTTLASGSSGNAALVSCGDTHVLLDAGISARRITTGLKSLGVDPADLSAILITHEHQDHVSGLAVLTKKIRPPIYATPATCGQLADHHRHGFSCDLILHGFPAFLIDQSLFPTPGGRLQYSVSTPWRQL